MTSSLGRRLQARRAVLQTMMTDDVTSLAPYTMCKRASNNYTEQDE